MPANILSIKTALLSLLDSNNAQSEAIRKDLRGLVKGKPSLAVDVIAECSRDESLSSADFRKIVLILAELEQGN